MSRVAVRRSGQGPGRCSRYRLRFLQVPLRQRLMRHHRELTHCPLVARWGTDPASAERRIQLSPNVGSEALCRPTPIGTSRMRPPSRPTRREWESRAPLRVYTVVRVRRESDDSARWPSMCLREQEPLMRVEDADTGCGAPHARKSRSDQACQETSCSAVLRTLRSLGRCPSGSRYASSSVRAQLWKAGQGDGPATEALRSDVAGGLGKLPAIAG